MSVNCGGTARQSGSADERIKSALLAAEKFRKAGSWSSAPLAKAPKMSKTERSKWSGGCAEIRSLGVNLKYVVAQSMKCDTLACVTGTPFGTPVEPEVYMM